MTRGRTKRVPAHLPNYSSKALIFLNMALRENAREIKKTRFFSRTNLFYKGIKCALVFGCFRAYLFIFLFIYYKDR